MELEELLRVGWREVATASKQRKHPFHTATYATLSAFGPESRTVTLRHAAALEEGGWELGFNADIRSPKALQSKNDSLSDTIDMLNARVAELGEAQNKSIDIPDDYEYYVWLWLWLWL